MEGFNEVTLVEDDEEKVVTTGSICPESEEGNTVIEELLFKSSGELTDLLEFL
jgi:hypothetical protein